MKLHHRHSFFPLVLACLTLTLTTLMFFSFARQREVSQPVVAEVTSVSTPEYDEQLKQLGHDFMISYQTLQDEPSRSAAVSVLLQDVLSLRVPVSEKEFHLSLAVTLNEMQQTLKEKKSDEKETELFHRIVSLMQSKGIEYVAD